MFSTQCIGIFHLHFYDNYIPDLYKQVQTIISQILISNNVIVVLFLKDGFLNIFITSVT